MTGWTENRGRKTRQGSSWGTVQGEAGRAKTVTAARDTGRMDSRDTSKAKSTRFGTWIKRKIKDDSEVSDFGYWVEGEKLPRQKKSRGRAGLEGVSGLPPPPKIISRSDDLLREPWAQHRAHYVHS